MVPNIISNFSTHLTTISMVLNQIFGRIPKGFRQLFGLTDIIMADNYMEGIIPELFHIQ